MSVDRPEQTHISVVGCRIIGDGNSSERMRDLHRWILSCSANRVQSVGPARIHLSRLVERLHATAGSEEVSGDLMTEKAQRKYTRRSTCSPSW
jgi:hypothetical protein